MSYSDYEGGRQRGYSGYAREEYPEDHGGRRESWFSKHGTTLGFCGCRSVTLAAAVTMIALESIQIQALVRETAGGKNIALPTSLIAASAVYGLYNLISLFLYLHQTKAWGARYKWMGILDLAIALAYMIPTVYYCIVVPPLSCDKDQFLPGNLNRYGMGYFESDHSLQGWAKSSPAHCIQSKSALGMLFLIDIFGSMLAFLALYHWHQNYRVRPDQMDKPFRGGRTGRY